MRGVVRGYHAREVRFLDVWKPSDWMVKVYGVAYGREAPRSETVEGAKRVALDTLPTPAVTNDRYGVGVLIVHEGEDSRWALVDWWGYEFILHQCAFVAPHEGDADFEPVPDHITVCVWELPVLMFERDAWVETVLRDPHKPDLQGYMARSFSATV
jgi:hypothetical protein